MGSQDEHHGGCLPPPHHDQLLLQLQHLLLQGELGLNNLDHHQVLSQHKLYYNTKIGIHNSHKTYLSKTKNGTIIIISGGPHKTGLTL